MNAFDVDTIKVSTLNGTLRRSISHIHASAQSAFNLKRYLR